MQQGRTKQRDKSFFLSRKITEDFTRNKNRENFHDEHYTESIRRINREQKHREDKQCTPQLPITEIYKDRKPREAIRLLKAAKPNTKGATGNKTNGVKYSQVTEKNNLKGEYKAHSLENENIHGTGINTTKN